MVNRFRVNGRLFKCMNNIILTNLFSFQAGFEFMGLRRSIEVSQLFIYGGVKENSSVWEVDRTILLNLLRGQSSL